jgi:polysaccharide pyruvyl transferase WcaK-like protein
MKKNQRFKKIVISSAYGMGNLGDEAICETIINDIFSINNEVQITILVFDKNLFFKAHPHWRKNKKISVESMNFRKNICFRPCAFLSLLKGTLKILFCDLFIWGGGGIIRNRPDWLKIYIIPLQIAQFFKKKIIIWSIGIDKITNSQVINLIKKIKKVDFFSIRDNISKRNLLNVSKIFKENEIQVIRDPVFHFLESKIIVNPQQKIYNIGLNLSFWKADFSNEVKIDRFINSLANVFNELSEEINFKILYLPTVPSKDNILFEKLKSKLISQLKIETPFINTPGEYLNRLSALNLFIGMRMHSIILASNIDNLPIVGIIYDEKTIAIKRELNLNNNFFYINEISSKSFLFRNYILSCLKEPQSFLVNFKEFRENSKKMLEILKLYL